MDFPRLILEFPFWWYYTIPLWFLRMAQRVFLFIDRQFSVILMLRFWLTPIFGDPNIVGRSVGFVFRTFRIFIGLVLIAAAELSIVFYFIVWLMIPFLIFSRIGFISLFLLFFWLIVHVFLNKDKPLKEITPSFSESEDLEQYLSFKARRFYFSNRGLNFMFDSLFKDRFVSEVVLRLGFSGKGDFLKEIGSKKGRLENLPLKTVLTDSLKIALGIKDKYVEPYHLFLTLLKKTGFKFDEALEVISWLRKSRSWHRVPMIWENDYLIEGSAGFNRSWTGRVTPFLNRYGSDLTYEAQSGRLPILVGKKKPLAEVVRVLEKNSKNNVLLVGQPGCGKTSLVYGIAEEIASGTRSRALMDHRLFSLEIGKLMAGAKTEGDIEERMLEIIRDVEGSGNIILFIDETQNAVSAGGGVDNSLVFSTLEPHLSTGRFQLIGATSWKNYRRFIEPNEAFARLFELVEVAEAGFAESLEVLELTSFDLEKRYKVKLSFAALKSAVELSTKYIHDRVLPDKAIDLLEETVAEAAKNPERRLVLSEDVEKIVSEKTNIPLAKVGEQESRLLLDLEKRMHERLINQDEAVTAIADAIRRARVGLRDEKRPISSLLFVGPTGVGKTETAKTLAETFFGREETMIRFDMSEYQNQESLGNIIAILTESVRRMPFSLILFDEVEKAHPRILDIFLQILEEGRLTDSAGLTVFFGNAIIVFTSNVGTKMIFEKLREGTKIEDFRSELFKELTGNFRIELLNRFDGIIVFKPLTAEQVEMVARLKLNKVVQEMEKNGVKISFTDGLIKRLAGDGFDTALGARPLRRLIQDKIESVLARRLLRGEIKKDETYLLGEEILEV